jgi:hypothetical protein
MKRKLIKQGEAYTLTLPINWIRSLNLKPSEEIDISEVEGNLLVSAKPNEAKKEISTTLTSDKESHLRPFLNALYWSGYDKIIITFNSIKQRKVINSIIDNYFWGFEVIEEKDNQIITESVSEPIEEKADIILKRIFFIINENFNIINKDFRTNKFDNILQIVNNTRKINRYNNFCRRTYVKQRIHDDKLIYRWEFLVKILYIQYSVLHLYEILDKDKPKSVTRTTKELTKSVQELFKRLQTAFFKKEVKIIQEINIHAIDLLYNDIHQNMRKTQKTETLILYYLGELTRLINLINTPLINLITI